MQNHFIKPTEQYRRDLNMYQHYLNDAATFMSIQTGQPIEVINRDTERDNYMTAEEALKYGLIDGIMDKRR